MKEKTYRTDAGVEVAYLQQSLEYAGAIEPLLSRLDCERGALYASNFEFPGRYTCWDIGFVNPPVVLTSRKDTLHLTALNQRGQVLIEIFRVVLGPLDGIDCIQGGDKQLVFKVQKAKRHFIEEERSLQPSVFSVIRRLLQCFKFPDEPYIGFYGAYAYDLIFQFEKIEQQKKRDKNARDMVIYLPDEIYVVNHRKEEAFIRTYDFSYLGNTTRDLPRDGEMRPCSQESQPVKTCCHQPGKYEETVAKALEKFKQGELFEVVPSQTFYHPARQKPSVIFERLRQSNPSPYGFLINLGENEHLVGASPEMYVRVKGRRVETCPISGTIKRGENPIEDSEQIVRLLQSEKEKAELTMCTDVDRNDKSRICQAGSVKVIGRRQIEIYSRLIHTVDHVEGKLRDGFDAVDAFLTHMWVVTVTGAPKLWAMQFIETHETTPRAWYAGAVGWFGFNGDLNTGLTLRTIRLKEGVAEIRAGATLLIDSNPKAEEQETRLKASALHHVLSAPNVLKQSSNTCEQTGQGKTVLLIDNEDSFVHTLANYFRQTGAKVVTTREGIDSDLWDTMRPSMLAISPGPGRPSDFNLSAVIDKALRLNLPLFGVCLGLQAIVEYFGGKLNVLDYPMHGKPSNVINLGGRLLSELPRTFIAGRYHSLYAQKDVLPKQLQLTAESEDGVVMAIEGIDTPIYGVQFHPETILSLGDRVGIRLIEHLMRLIH